MLLLRSLRSLRREGQMGGVLLPTMQEPILKIASAIVVWIIGYFLLATIALQIVGFFTRETVSPFYWPLYFLNPLNEPIVFVYQTPLIISAYLSYLLTKKQILQRWISKFLLNYQ